MKKIVTVERGDDGGRKVRLDFPTLIDWPSVLGELTRNGWLWRNNGRFERVAMGESHQTPWLHSTDPIPGMDEAGDCKWQQIVLFNGAYEKTAVPLFCLECYKVVAIPRNMEEALVVYEWQQGTPWPSKTGPELRAYTPRLWGAYWYCRGVEEGRERYRQVREWVDENLSPEVRVFLKRGCTEYEQALGDSSKWEPHPHAEEIEAEAKEIVDSEPWRERQSLPVVSSILRRWMAWSKENDTPPTTYHDDPEEP